MRGVTPARAARGGLPGFGLSTGFTIFHLGLEDADPKLEEAAAMPGASPRPSW